MSLTVRPYRPDDYAQVESLYRQGDLYGGQFDEDRDSHQRLNRLIEQSPDAILVAERDGALCGTVTLIQDVRTAWLFRFAAAGEDVAAALYERAVEVLKAAGHRQVLVYAPAGDKRFIQRYDKLGFATGGTYTCY